MEASNLSEEAAKRTRYVDICETVSLADFFVIAANAVIKSTREQLGRASLGKANGYTKYIRFSEN